MCPEIWGKWGEGEVNDEKVGLLMKKGLIIRP